ncbi:hypothetical protein JCM11641_005985 [Rhodosporidiobolus odoratus]
MAPIFSPHIWIFVMTSPSSSSPSFSPALPVSPSPTYSSNPPSPPPADARRPSASTTLSWSPSESSRSVSFSLSSSLAGPTPCPSRPLSFVDTDIDSGAPTRVGSPAPSVKGKDKAEEEGEEKGDDVDVEAQAEKEDTLSPQAEEYPEGGLRAWLAVLGSTLVLMCTFGLSNSYGVFLTYYSTHTLSHYTTSQISWIGSSHLFITFSSAFLAGVVFDRGYFQHQLFFGSVGWLIGMFCLSLAKEFWQIFLSQSVCMGLSLGAMFSPCLSVLGTYFKQRRAFVVGIAASGTAIGAVIFPIMLSRLFEEKGFGEGVRAAGYLMLALLIIANVVTRPRLLPSAFPTVSADSPSLSARSPAAPPARAPLLPLLKKISKDRAAWLVMVGVFCVYTCCFIPLFYVVSFSKQYVGADSSLAEYSLSIINALAFFSRIISGLLADRLGTFNTVIPLAISVSILTFGMMGCTSPGSLVAFLVLFGVAQGGWISVCATCFMTLAGDASEIGLRSGIGFFFVALATLIGSPIAGALLQSTQGDYSAALCFGGSMACVGVGLLVLGRREVARRKGMGRV